MAGVSDKAVVRLSGGAGLNNLADESAIGLDQLRAAENVDLHRAQSLGPDQAPKVRVARRAGYTKLLDLTRAHSAFGDGALPFLLLVAGGDLCAWDGSGDAFVVQAGVGHREATYALVGDRVFWSNGHDQGRVLLDGAPADFAPEAPAGQPALTALTTGGLYAGTYQVAITYRDASGEESGTGEGATVAVPEGGGIALSGIPQPISAQIVSVRIYITGADDTVFRFVRDLPAGMPTASLGAGQRGRQLETQFLEPLPPARILRAFNGRLLAAVGGKRLVWSVPLRPGQYAATDNFVSFTQIDLMEPLGDGTDGAGVFVADHKRTYWLGGANPADWSRRIAYPHGAVPGTAHRVGGSVFGLDTKEPVVYWIASNGVGCLGLPGGVVMPLRDKQVVAPAARRGATLWRDEGGLAQLITTLQDTRAQRAAVSDRATATVYPADGEA